MRCGVGCAARRATRVAPALPDPLSRRVRLFRARRYRSRERCRRAGGIRTTGRAVVLRRARRRPPNGGGKAGRPRLARRAQAAYRPPRAARAGPAVTASRDYRDFLDDIVEACRSIIEFVGAMTLGAYLADR